ncbi:hypothetical protein [Pseudoalteromonas arctica]|uniref:Lipoprotein n=1 Tax=Pseudoalteromonas arctica TaxID=394751 RepID=A0A7Y0DQ50_9GAMM|nr:hypothetical protein [Pseudoalteromonas arctica]NMM39585.1 hypothetical protein [Pseudoalteromonas arctica]
MINNIKLQLLIISIALTSGCNKNETPAGNAENNINSNDEKAQEVALKTPQKLKDVETTLLVSSSINNNGEKISYKTDKLLKGTTVHNHTTSEQGVVTGAVFITLKSDDIPLALKSTYNTKKITKHTYQFLVDKNTDLKSTISDLKQYTIIDTIEIAINYSPIEDQF